MNKKTYAALLLAILLFSINTTSHAEDNIPKGIGSSMATAAFGASTLILVWACFDAALEVIKDRDPGDLVLVSATAIGAVATGWKAKDFFQETYKNFQGTYKKFQKAYKNFSKKFFQRYCTKCKTKINDQKAA